MWFGPFKVTEPPNVRPFYFDFTGLGQTTTLQTCLVFGSGSGAAKGTLAEYCVVTRQPAKRVLLASAHVYGVGPMFGASTAGDALQGHAIARYLSGAGQHVRGLPG
jgi:hypothetical protein